MDNWGQGTFTLYVSRLYRRAIGISDVEDVSFPMFSPRLALPVAPQLTVVTRTLARSGVAMFVQDAHAASVVPREAAAPEMTVVRASSSNAR